MKFRISGGWPVAGGLLTGDIDAAVLPWISGLIPPLNCTPLDEEAWLVMQAHYPAHLVGGPPPPSTTKTSTRQKEK
jgi:hypothetical protein